MAKTRHTWIIPRYLLFQVLSLLIISLLTLITVTKIALANPDEVRWSVTNLPTEGNPSGWILAKDSNTKHLTMANDGSLYCYATPSSTSYTLYKSTDNGHSWSHTGNVKDVIVDIATAPDDTKIYYATSSNVYKSTDAGCSFISLPQGPGGSGSNNIEITAIDVAKVGSHNIVAVSTRDTDSSQFGGVFVLDESDVFSSWIDTSTGNYDVYDVAFSPNFGTDRGIVAVATDETNIIVTTKISSTGWGQTIGDSTISTNNIVNADIAFPDDYDTAAEGQALFVAIDTDSGNGDVYMINHIAAPFNSIATDLNIGSAYGYSNVDITTLAIIGNANATSLLAGAADNTQVYSSNNGGINWVKSTKPPTGRSQTYVLMATDFNSSGRAFITTSGNESAFSYSSDSGNTWNQISLIDTKISNIIDLALSTNYSQDETLFMLTWGGKHSLWRSSSGGLRWERVFSSAPASVDSIDGVKLSPNYGNSQVIFLIGSSNGKPAVWKSADNGQSLSSPWVTHDPETSATMTINTWTIVDDNTLFIGSYDGSKGRVYQTTNSGFFYSIGATAGDQSLNSIALSPAYSENGIILIGNTNGWIYWSNDNGLSFEPLPSGATSPPLSGNIAVTFDHQFNQNNTVYAASDTADKGIYRFIIGTSTAWESIDSSLPPGSKIVQTVVGVDGTLYAINSKTGGGMERCLNPTYSLGLTFETVTRGLNDNATMTGLRLYGNRLWSIDTTNNQLVTFTDSLTAPVTLSSPIDKSPGVGTLSSQTITNITLDWEASKGATSYQW